MSNSDDVVLYSPISVAELWAGARPKEYDAQQKLFLALTCAPIDEAIGHQAGIYLRQYRRSHAAKPSPSDPDMEDDSASLPGPHKFRESCQANRSRQLPLFIERGCANREAQGRRGCPEFS